MITGSATVDVAREGLIELLEIMLTRIVNPVTAHLGLFFAEDWTLRSDEISYGHDIEASWLLTEAAATLRDPALTDRTHALAVRIAAVTLAEGIDTDGGVYNEGGPFGLTNTNKEWWPQAEAVVGFINAYQLSGEERFLRAALHTWDFIEQRLIDRQHDFRNEQGLRRFRQQVAAAWPPRRAHQSGRGDGEALALEPALEQLDVGRAPDAVRADRCRCSAPSITSAATLSERLDA